MPRAAGDVMDEDLDRRAGKPPDEAHPIGESGTDDADPSDYADPRVVQPGEDPPGEDAMRRPTTDTEGDPRQ